MSRSIFCAIFLCVLVGTAVALSVQPAAHDLDGVQITSPSTADFVHPDELPMAFQLCQFTGMDASEQVFNLLNTHNHVVNVRAFGVNGKPQGEIVRLEPGKTVPYTFTPNSTEKWGCWFSNK